jgi:predicted acetyltransferase
VTPVRRGEGVFRRLVEAELASFVQEGLAAAVLVSSRPALYRDFGFGVASFSAAVQVEAAAGRRQTAVGLTLADRDAAVGAAADVYERLRPRVPGMLDRTETWWLYSFPGKEDDEANPTLFALHDDGYAAYSVQQGWTAEGRPANTLVLHECLAGSAAAYGALWTYCLGLEHCTRVEAANRPVDEPLPHVLDDPARLRQSLADGLHVRILDVERALAARRYSAEGELVLAVHDDGGTADGEFLLAAGGEGAECTRTSRPAALALDAGALSAAYLGGTSFESLRLAGSVEELEPGAARRADRLFSWSPAPWLPWDY